MVGFVTKALHRHRMFIYLLLGMLLMLIIQHVMIAAPRKEISIFSGDSTEYKKDTVELQRTSITSSTAKLQLSSPSTLRTLVNISIPNVSKNINYSSATWNLRRPRIKVNVDSTLKDFKKMVTDLRKKFCTHKSKWNETLSSHLGPVTSNMESWKFRHTVECPDFNISEVKYDRSRPKLSIKCNRKRDLFDQLKWTDNASDVYVAQFGDDCVDTFIQTCCKGPHRVPNVVHYVWYMRGELSFVGFTSLLGVIRFINPCAIIFHGDNIPRGKYWDYIVNISPNIINLKRDRLTFISGQKIQHVEHSSDIMRIEALTRYGGIYMDTDTIIVKSLKPLMNFPCVMSNQSSGLMGSAFVMAEKNASFLQLWMDGYRYNYRSSKYIYNAMIYPKLVAQKHKDLIHIEYATISRPANMIGGKIYYNEFATYDWSYIYGIHLYSRIYKKPFNEYTIRNMNTTVGSISRHVVFGNKELCN